MKIAFLNPWQNRAENQVFEALSIAAARIGHELVHCANSMEVAACAPDFVIASSSLQPKLNDVPHYAIIHSFRDLYLTHRPHYENILTCDGYLTIADSLARFIRDLTFATGHPREAGFSFVSCQRSDLHTDLPTLIATRSLQIAYCGTNWDTSRAEIVQLLARHPGIRVFGPEQSWSTLDPKSYGGMLPFDGESVQRIYAETGIGLCLLSDQHYRDDVISNRIFEVASVGALAICPDIPWLRRHFGDAVYYIDQSLPYPYLVRQILLRREEIYRDPAAAIDKARRAREIFEGQFAAEVLLENAVTHHRRVSADRQAALAQAADQAPVISVIIRCGSRPIETIRHAVDSIAAQTFGRFDIILVRHSTMDLTPLTSLAFPNVESIRVIDAPAGKRSTSLWAGLGAVKGKFFAVLDDDDWNFSNHFETLFHPVGTPPPDRFFAYSGVIMAQPGPIPIHGGGSDNRRLAHFGIASTEDLFAISGAFTPNCFVASSNLLNPALLLDPQLSTPEDTYLILSLLAQVDPKFSYAATAVYETGRPGQSDFANHPLRFEDELTIQLRLHGSNLPRPGMAIRYPALSDFWKHRPAPKPPAIPTDLIENVATIGERAIQTTPQPWAYAVDLSINIPPGREGPGFLRVEILVTCGPIGIGILNRAGTDFLFRVPLGQCPASQTIDLPIDDFRQMGRFVVQNWDAPGVHSAHLNSLTAWMLQGPSVTAWNR